MTNVDEDGEATLSTVQPQDEREITARLSDPDGSITNTAWQWARGTSRTGPWTDITGEDNLGQQAIYEPAEDDVGRWLRATASYNDGHCPTCAVKKTAQAVSDNPVRAKPYSNTAPVFDEDPVTPDVQVSFDEDPDIKDVQMTIAENSPAGTAIGAPAAAKDLGQDGRQETLDYTLEEDDFLSFDIDAGTGQISVKAPLDFEGTKTTYSVIVRATDPSGASDNDASTITVKIMVTNVDEAPMISAGDISANHPENSNDFIGTETNVYRAVDPEGEITALKWTLSGTDASKFIIDAQNRLKFTDIPDFEAPGDSGRDNVYAVTVVVADSGGNEASRDVTVKVTNKQEDGVVTLSAPQLRVGGRITARLTDPDGSIVDVEWTWNGATSSGSSTSSTYTIVEADENQNMTAVATYTDVLGSSRQSASAIVEIDTDNEPPRFSATSQQRSVPEDTSTGSPIGTLVEAEDGDNDILTYSLGSTDAEVFAIDGPTGQISTKDALNYETKRSYRVTVTATDTSLRSVNTTVTINVTDVDEPPEITADDTAIDYAEGGTGPVDTYQATDPERATIVWTLEGDDAEDFSISSGGVLTFSERPDFEASGGDPVYNVTVRASDGGTLSDTIDVTITVTNVDEPGEITLSTLQPQENEEVTATTTDPDEVTGGSITWRWARSTSRSGPWTVITGTATSNNPVGRSANYTPIKDDVGKWLRVTARYTDGHGRGKAAQVVSANAVRRIPYVNKVPVFQNAEETPVVSTSRSIAENSKVNTSVGDPVAATDIGENDRQEALTYTLSGNNDDGKFDIDRRTGQIKTKVILNYDSDSGAADNCADKNACVVTVTATDPSGFLAPITVNIGVTNVDEAPVFDGDANTPGFQDPLRVLRVEENKTEIDANLIENDVQDPTYRAVDPENPNAMVELTLAGADADHFAIGTDGVLSFREVQDYEDPADSGGNRFTT